LKIDVRLSETSRIAISTVAQYASQAAATNPPMAIARQVVDAASRPASSRVANSPRTRRATSANASHPNQVPATATDGNPTPTLAARIAAA
jgi:hypothetical protein